MTKRSGIREPRTKAEFLNRILSIDFSGDLRDLSDDRNVILKRAGANVLDLTFPRSGMNFQMVIRRPRSEEALAKRREAQARDPGSTPRAGQQNEEVAPEPAAAAPAGRQRSGARTTAPPSEPEPPAPQPARRRRQTANP